MKLDRFTYDWWNDKPQKEDDGEDRHRDGDEAEDEFKAAQVENNDAATSKPQSGVSE